MGGLHIADIMETKDGKRLYMKVIHNVTLQRGELLTIVDPRRYLSDRRLFELEHNGSIPIQTNRRRRTLYKSTYRQVFKQVKDD